MVETELINAAAVVAGGLIGSAALTVFPYFMGKGAVEKQQQDIRMKPPETRTPEENYILSAQYPGFMQEYKWRFSFGLLGGLALTFAYLSSNVGTVGTLTTLQAIITGITTFGFLTALVDKIRSSGGNTATPVLAEKKQ